MVLSLPQFCDLCRSLGVRQAIIERHEYPIRHPSKRDHPSKTSPKRHPFKKDLPPKKGHPQKDTTKKTAQKGSCAYPFSLTLTRFIMSSIFLRLLSMKSKVCFPCRLVTDSLCSTARSTDTVWQMVPDSFVRDTCRWVGNVVWSGLLTQMFNLC